MGKNFKCFGEIPRSPSNVQLIPTEDLVQELFSRYDTAIFVGHLKTTKEEGNLAWNTKGCKYTMIGIWQYMQNLIETQAFDGEAGCQGDD